MDPISGKYWYLYHNIAALNIFDKEKCFILTNRPKNFISLQIDRKILFINRYKMLHVYTMSCICLQISRKMDEKDMISKIN